MRYRHIYNFFLLIYLFTNQLLSQDYPYWFLYQEKVKCNPSIIGYSHPAYYQESSCQQAFNNGCVNYARQLWTNFSGGQAFLSTEIGAFWMGADFIETFDTTTVSKGVSLLKTLDKYISNEIAIVFLSSNTGKLSYNKKRIVSLKELPTPGWIKTIPNEKNYDYAVGMAPNFYYEASSWIEAERLARKNLACNQYVTIKSMQKTAAQTQEIQYEEILITLQNIEIVERWRDIKNGIFYVLIRVSKHVE